MDSLTKVSLMNLEIILDRLTVAPAPADAARLCMNRATSSSRMRWNDCTRATLSSSSTVILRSWRHRSP